jgi:hypothetical protein
MCASKQKLFETGFNTAAKVCVILATQGANVIILFHT